MSFQHTVLAGLMTHGKSAWEEHAAGLDADMFDGDLQDVYRAIESLHAADRLVDVVTVAERLPEHQELLKSIADNFTSTATLGAHISELKIQHNANRAKDIGAMLLETGDFETARMALDGIGDTSAQNGTVDSRKTLAAFMDELDRGDDFIGLPTGLTRLDEILGGLSPADLIILAGRPSMGKTAAMMHIVKQTVLNSGPVGIFSLEMPKEKLIKRLVATYGIDFGRLQRPKTLTDTDWPKITHANQKIYHAHQMHINDTGGLSIGAIEAEARRMVNRLDCKLICVDYLQLVTCKAEKRHEVVAEVSRRLKALAKNLKVPVIALSQLNRDSENRINPRPTMAMLRESGQIEQDADMIIFVDRPEQRDNTVRPGEADLIVEKNRDGQTGTAQVSWVGKYQRFADLAIQWTSGAAA